MDSAFEIFENHKWLARLCARTERVAAEVDPKDPTEGLTPRQWDRKHPGTPYGWQPGMD